VPNLNATDAQLLQIVSGGAAGSIADVIVTMQGIDGYCRVTTVSSGSTGTLPIAFGTWEA
jgi:hypothetical protein